MENGWRYFCARQRRKEGKEKGEEGESLCLFPSSTSASRLYFLPPPPFVLILPRVWCFIGERSRELFPFCYRYLPLPPPPDEINDGINDTALNIGDQPVSQPGSMGEDRFAYLPAKVSRRSIYLPLPSLFVFLDFLCPSRVFSSIRFLDGDLAPREIKLNLMKSAISE